MVADGWGCPCQRQIVSASLGDLDGVGSAWKAFNTCAVPCGLADIDGDNGGRQGGAEHVSGDDEKAILGVGLEARDCEHRLRRVDVL